MYFCRIVHDQVHEFVKAHNVTLDTGVDVLVEPHRDLRNKREEKLGEIWG